MKDPVEIFRECGGQLRMSEAIKRGISHYTLYSLRDSGVIEQISRGVYRLTELPPLCNPDLVTVAIRCPHAVVCLVSALSFHEITTQIPHKVSIAIPRDSYAPSLDYPQLLIHRFSDRAYEAGIEEHLMDGVVIKVYCPEKTIADCFKFRNKVGLDVVVEGLKMYKERMEFNHRKILQYARVCRVENVIRPYLEAMV